MQPTQELHLGDSGHFLLQEGEAPEEDLFRASSTHVYAPDARLKDVRLQEP